MSEYGLSAQQLQVIDALSSGATMIDAAEAAGIHRNTLSNWRRNQQEFRDALAHAHYDRALLVREQYEVRLDSALKALDDILADPKTPAAIRLKAALTIIEKASTPPPPQTEFVWAFHQAPFPKPAPVAEHNNAQSGPESVPPAETAPCPPPAQAETAPAVHKNAQPIRREGPKIGRNDYCPCGSGRKFKRCCLDKPLPAAA